VATLTGHTKWIKSIIVSGNLLLSGGWDSSLFMWDIETNKLLKEVKMNMGPISSIQSNLTKVFVVCREEGYQHQIVVLDYGRNWKTEFK
jgi:WD40 repeat protein